MEAQLKVVMLEDAETDAELEQLALRKAGIDCVTRRVETEADFRAALMDFAPDIILSDFTLPGAIDGMSALSIARKQRPETPYIFVSGTIGEERAVEALKHGATDYVLKDNLARLAPSVRRALQEGEERRRRRQAEQELGETKDRLDSILSSLRDVIWSMSADGQAVLYVNPAVEEVYNRPASQFHDDAQLWLEVVHPEDRDQVLSQWLSVLAGNSLDLQYRILCPGNVVRWLHDRRRPTYREDHTIARIDGIARDITERKEQEERIARLSRIHAVLSGINGAIVRIRDRQALFREACRIAVEQGGFTLAWIGTAAPGATKVTPAAWMDAEQSYLDEVGSLLMDLTDDPGAAGRALRDKQPIIANDIETDPQIVFKQQALARSYRSLAVLPLLVAGEPVGVLALYTRERGFFDHQEMKLLTELTGDIAFALESIDKEERLSYLAYYDPLSGLPNRALVSDRLNQLLHRMAHSNEENLLAVAAIDVDRFRIINDSLGRHVGDTLLKLIAERLTDTLSAAHSLARLHNDCYVAVFSDAKGAAEVVHRLEEALNSIDRPFGVDGKELRLSAKAGIALFPGDGNDADTLFRNAEIALRRAKTSGERYLFYAAHMNARITQRLSLETKLRKAVEEQQFVLHYQPKVDLATGRLSGLEALIRWNDPETTLVLPAMFIPLLEEVDLILPVGRWVMEKAAATWSQWQQQGLQPPRIAVNVSATQFRQKNFVQGVSDAIEKGHHGHLDLEITEGVIMDDIERATSQLLAIKEMGIGVAIDDFGTGYSSLSYLTKLPLTLLKIDRSFITNLASSAASMSIVSTIISLAHALSLRVCAEGVETDEHAKLLRLIRCDEMQGYLLSRPVPAESIETMLADRNRK